MTTHKSNDEKPADTASGSSPCSGAGVEESADRLPPNLRPVECCHSCSHETGVGFDWFCGLHKYETRPAAICDDYK